MILIRSLAAASGELDGAKGDFGDPTLGNFMPNHFGQSKYEQQGFFDKKRTHQHRKRVSMAFGEIGIIVAKRSDIYIGFNMVKVGIIGAKQGANNLYEDEDENQINLYELKETNKEKTKPKWITGNSWKTGLSSAFSRYLGGSRHQQAGDEKNENIAGGMKRDSAASLASVANQEFERFPKNFQKKHVKI